MPNLEWVLHDSYGDAQHREKCIYVFKQGNSYLYIGKAKRFGGPSGRYANGYRYLVESLLQSGAKLWILELRTEWGNVKNIENTLINSKKGQRAVNKQRTKNYEVVEWLVGP